MKEVNLYTDGACRGNPGPGGFGAVLEYKGKEKEICGGFASTTNNRMELMAVIAGLETLNEPCVVKIYSDSKYIVDSIKKGWLSGWSKNGWKKSDKKPVLNVDLWQKLLFLMEKHETRFFWVKGHDGHSYNERCDKLATEAADRAAERL